MFYIQSKVQIKYNIQKTLITVPINICLLDSLDLN